VKRYLRHLVLLKITLLSITAAALIGQMDGVLERMSLVSAWLCLVFFCGTLLIGPKTMLSGKPVPVNILLRRDLGIWTALTGITHFWLGTAFSMNQDYMGRFVSDELTESWFFWGSIWGFVTGLLCLILLLASNNKFLRRVGATWWKRVQRLAYPTFVLTVVHGVYFQLLENRGWFLWGMLALAVIVLAGQGIGVIQFRKQKSSPVKT